MRRGMLTGRGSEWSHLTPNLNSPLVGIYGGDNIISHTTVIKG